MNRQHREAGGPQYGSVSAPRVNLTADLEAGQDHSGPPRRSWTQIWGQDRPTGEYGPAQSVPPRTGGRGSGRGRGGRGGTPYVARQPSSEPEPASTTTVAMEPPPSSELQSLKISVSSVEWDNLAPNEWADEGGQVGTRQIQRLVNQFPVSFTPKKIYHLDIQAVIPNHSAFICVVLFLVIVVLIGNGFYQDWQRPR